MSYCQYHPLVAASHHCGHCQHDLCRSCIDDGHPGEDSRCLLCNHGVDSLGVTADAVPFWRRIDQAFRYPVKTEVLVLIGIISLFTAIASFLPLPLMIGLSLLCSGVMIKYCFNCLSATALGEMSPPDISGAYQGGVTLVLRILLAIVLLLTAVGFVFAKVSPALAGLLGFFILLALPAMIILYAMTENLLEALNPLRQLHLITTIGLPYGLILALLMIMMASVDLLSALVGHEPSVIVFTVQAAISNFYSVVMFHLMGYMIFQYQHRLGFTAEASDQSAQTQRPEQSKALAQIQIMIKEGFWGSAEQAFRQALQRFPDDEPLNSGFFQFTLSVLPAADAGQQVLAKRQQAAVEVFDGYFAFLLRSGQKDKIYFNLKLVCLKMKRYLPLRPELRHQLAQICREHANPKLAARLLNGLHRAFPDYPQLVPACELLCEALEDIPNMQSHAQQGRRLVSALQERALRQPRKRPATPDRIPLAETLAPVAASAPVDATVDAAGGRELAPIEFKL